MNNSLDISSQHLEIIASLLRQHLSPEIKVWVFGSRVGQTAGKSSDLDLALEGGQKIGLQVMANLRYAFEESNLPYKVDLVDMSAIDDSFKAIIEKTRVPFPLSE